MRCLLDNGCGFANAGLHIGTALATIVAVPERAEDVAVADSANEQDQVGGHISVKSIIVATPEDEGDGDALVS
ncbi:hypothetical protein N8E89_19320 (plasmid) [Phyllobacterium sp. A18/5-2]|uniref:hypothetical protein n=1 Tax=Phyllobacterium sp. A18/5-2 TaxID=2978392 RepID=UPI0021C6AEA6|nr:hypothetical protein [Phyllobacterium sp. A18/5-2]UXN66760.1 hypothetical protein N8E89_19320 [Phyllobacterium sp. A18/5-2]